MLPATCPRLTGILVSLRPFQYGDEAMVASASTDPLVPLITTVPAGGTLPGFARSSIARTVGRPKESATPSPSRMLEPTKVSARLDCGPVRCLPRVAPRSATG